MTTFADNIEARRTAILAAACNAEESAAKLLDVAKALRQQTDKLETVEASPSALRLTPSELFTE